MTFSRDEINIIKVSAAVYEFVPLDESISKDINIEESFDLDGYIDCLINNNELVDYNVIISLLKLCLSQECAVLKRSGNSSSLQNYFGDPCAIIGVDELNELIIKIEKTQLNKIT
ncbi:hypothetical protein [Marinicellulosiphila megalodicopiae]|uniref:hypothetical protein n=1 Tax=Marinicellulosiphila megalodicopiae TaxID=2724896 RepID=UPI003BAE3894